MSRDPRCRSSRRVRMAPTLEPIERRNLLSTASPFASFQGVIDGGPGTPIAVTVDPADFGMAAGGRVLLRIEARALGEGSLDPGPTAIRGSSPADARTLTRRADIPGDTASVTVASVRPAALSLRTTAQHGSSGAFALEVSLAGDVDGDGRVDRSDLLAIRSGLGGRAGDSGFDPVLDINGDGRIGLIDLLITGRNFGASTQIRPLEATLGIDRAADPDGDGRVDSDVVAVVGRTTPGATVRLDRGADGSFDAETTADAVGRYRFVVPLADGPNPVAIEASDSFGQSASARITVIRGGPASTVSASFDFAQGDQGWQADFSDLPVDPDPIFELDSGIRPLPPEVGDGTGFLLQGHNRSDDLFMFLKRKLGTADGVLPHQAYEARFTITVASDAPSGAFGIGGAPGESVYLKAGASAVEPLPVAADGEVWLNVDKGQQSQGGAAASVVGTIANGQEPVESGPQPYASLTFEHTHAVPVRADAEGNLWLLVGTDSAFEGLTALYYQKIDVELVPVAS
ncbi:dockerin type I domain-containing protein [Tautonia sp. JC769]|uniref:dockerin type I domain-containing protein n=1 Tax=Tautonia sp. JC769 TaxID=3232135 RepID=UPI0034582F2F